MAGRGMFGCFPDGVLALDEKWEDLAVVLIMFG
jgi:hypothetical protein